MYIVCEFLNGLWEKCKPILKSERFITGIIMVIFGLITFPMFIAGIYSHPSADDYTFCYYTYKAAEDTQGFTQFIEVLRGAISAVKDAYMQWSGYYTGSFLAALRPNFYYENLAFLNSFILLAGLIISVFLFMRKLCAEALGFTANFSNIISCIVLTALIQLVPSASETFYWYTAGVTYTLLFGLSLVLVGNTLTGIYHAGLSWKRTILLSILALIVAGGILPVNIPVFGIMTAMMLDVWFAKKITICKETRIRGSVIYICFVTGVLVGSLSPSTFWRLGNLEGEQSVSILGAAVYSLYGSVSTAISFVTPLMVLVFVATSLVTLLFVKKTSYDFKHPFFLLLISYCVLFAAYFPIYYGTGFKLQYADSRYNSIIFFHFVILLGINSVYWTGWLYRKMEQMCHKNILKWGNIEKCVSVVVCCLLFALSLLVTVAQEERREPWSLRVVKELATGTLQQYDSEMDARYEDYVDGSKKIVGIINPSVIPLSVCRDNLENIDDDGWQLQAIAAYYGKEEVYIEQSESE